MKAIYKTLISIFILLFAALTAPDQDNVMDSSLFADVKNVELSTPKFNQTPFGALDLLLPIYRSAN